MLTSMSTTTHQHPTIRVVARYRRNAAIVTGLSLLAAAAFWLPGQLGWGGTPRHHSTLRSLTIDWPGDGQSAIAIPGIGHSASGPPAEVPIASVAKVMTAYVVLRHSPLNGNESGFTMTFNRADVLVAAAAKTDGQSYVPVQVGETMTERQALEALLLPSANNIAQALATHIAGSVSAFVKQMNAEAATLRMSHSAYTDPSGLDPSTVSTAADQLRLARAAMRNPTFAEIVAMSTAQIPVAGTITNTDSLLGHDGFVGIKTGSTDAAGGCFMFEARQALNGHQRAVIGVVLGQRGGSLIHAGLTAAQDLVDDVMTQLATSR
jgi:serine-type D-Ala-D-Ala carboxypeptidase (penicillin-binding protein 5/6)